MARKPDPTLVPRPFTLPSNPTPTSASLFNRDDPESLINTVEGTLYESLLKVEASMAARRILRMNEKQLRELKPTAQDSRLRISFWDEHARAVESGNKMKQGRIFAGIVAQETFEENYLGNVEALALLCNIPPAYYAATQEILMSGIERLRDIIELPLTNAKGQVQPAVIAGIIKAVDMLDKRIHGASLQRIAVHQHHTGGTPAAVDNMPEGTLAQDQIAMLEREIASVKSKLSEKYAVLPSANGMKTVVEIGGTDGEET